MKLRNLIYLYDLTFALASKELKSKYKSTAFGFLWIVINPLLQMLVLTIVFSFIIKIQIDNYPLFVFSGLLPWMFFSLSVQAGTSSLIANRDLIKKVPFPREILPISSVVAHLFIFVLSLILLVMFVIIAAGLWFPLLFLIPLVVLVALFAISLSLLLSSLDVYYRDVSFMLQAILVPWFYLTPILYPISFVPKLFLGFYQLNPMVGIITAFQAIFLGENMVAWSALGVSVLETVILLVVGFFVFKKRSKYFADWV